MSIIVFDIETVANEKAKEYVDQKEYSAPSNYKDEEKILKYMEKEKQKDLDKAGLFWVTGKVVTICTEHIDTGDKMTFSNESETDLLIDFFRYISDIKDLVLIGKNSVDFDEPFIIGRALVNDIGIPKVLRKNISDVDHIFSRSVSGSQRGKLSDYAFGIGLAKLDSGKNVQEMFDNNKMCDIIKYCEQDVNITANILKRYFKEFK